MAKGACGIKSAIVTALRYRIPYGARLSMRQSPLASSPRWRCRSFCPSQPKPSICPKRVGQWQYNRRRRYLKRTRYFSGETSLRGRSHFYSGGNGFGFSMVSTKRCKCAFLPHASGDMPRYMVSSNGEEECPSTGLARSFRRSP